MIEINSTEFSGAYDIIEAIRIKKMLKENVSIDTIMRAFEMNKEDIEKIKNSDSTWIYNINYKDFFRIEG